MLFLRVLLLILSVNSIPLLAAPSGPFIGTIAGGGPDDQPALEAMLAHPRSVAPGPGGGFYIGTSFNVYHVDTLGQLRRLAGNGSGVSTGDGGPATEAGLTGVDGMAVDAAGNLYISSSEARRVRRIDAVTGIIDTVAGPGQFGEFGDGGPAVDAYLSRPEGLAVDAAGDLYIADRYNCSVRRVDVQTGVISSVLGNAFHSCGFNGDGTPALGNGAEATDVAFDRSGNLLVAAFRHIYVVETSTGLMYRVAGSGTLGNGGDGGPALGAQLEAQRIAVDAAGDIYVTAYFESRVRRVHIATGIISTFAGDGTDGSTGDGGPASLSRLNRPVGLAFTTTGLLIADDLNHRVRRVDSSGANIVTVAGRYDVGDGLPARQVPMIPQGIATDAAGNLYIADGLHERVRRVDAMTGILTTVAGNGSRAHSGDGGPATQAGLAPFYLAFDPTGGVFVGDPRNSRVRRIDLATGIITTVAGGGGPVCSNDGIPASQACFNYPIRGIATDAAGNLFVGDGYIQAPEPPPDDLDHRVRRIDASTGIIGTVARPAFGIQSLAAGPAGAIYFGDGGYYPAWTDWELFGPVGNIIRRVDTPGGTMSIVAGNGLFGFGGDGGQAPAASITWPGGIAVDGTGNLYFSDTSNDRVRRIDASTGIITTATGDGVSRFRGDGGPAAAARVSRPGALAIDRDGDLIIADRGNNRVRIVTSNCAKLPPLLSVTAEPPFLWPPNHRMIDVVISAQPACSGSEPEITSVVSSEPDDAPGGGDGNTTDDIQNATIGSTAPVIRLRAERSAAGPGRIYTATYSATDALGRTASVVVIVPVPHDRRGITDPLDISLEETPLGTIVEWTPVAGATSYNVVRGSLRRLHESANDLHLGPLECVEGGSTGTTTRGREDPEEPAAGEIFFYLVEYLDASGPSSYGEEGAAKPRDQSSGGCR